MQDRLMIFAVISALLMLTIYSSSSTLEVFGATKGPIYCTGEGGGKLKCCQSDFDDKGNVVATWCTTCDVGNPPSNCTPREKSSPEPNPGKELLNTLQPGIFKDPTIVTPELDQEQDEKTGGVFEQPKSNDTLSQDDIGNLE